MISRDAKERMELEVTFREYSLSTPNPETGGQERGGYHGSFTQWFRGGTPAEILELATQWAKDQSAKLRVDVRVWEMPVTVTPRGVVSR